MNAEYWAGLYAGVIGGAVMNVLAYLAHNVFQVSEANFVDWVALFAYGYKAQTLLEALVALFIHIVWSAFLGVTIVLTLSPLRIRRPLSAAWLAALVFWFFTKIVTILLKLPPFVHTTVGTTITYLICVSVFGLIVGVFMQRLAVTTGSR